MPQVCGYIPRSSANLGLYSCPGNTADDIMPKRTPFRRHETFAHTFDDLFGDRDNESDFHENSYGDLGFKRWRRVASVPAKENTFRNIFGGDTDQPAPAFVKEKKSNPDVAVRPRSAPDGSMCTRVAPSCEGNTKDHERSNYRAEHQDTGRRQFQCRSEHQGSGNNRRESERRSEHQDSGNNRRESERRSEHRDSGNNRREPERRSEHQGFGNNKREPERRSEHQGSGNNRREPERRSEHQGSENNRRQVDCRSDNHSTGKRHQSERRSNRQNSENNRHNSEHRLEHHDSGKWRAFDHRSERRSTSLRTAMIPGTIAAYVATLRTDETTTALLNATPALKCTMVTAQLSTSIPGKGRRLTNAVRNAMEPSMRQR